MAHSQLLRALTDVEVRHVWERIRQALEEVACPDLGICRDAVMGRQVNQGRLDMVLGCVERAFWREGAPGEPYVPDDVSFAGMAAKTEYPEEVCEHIVLRLFPDRFIRTETTGSVEGDRYALAPKVSGPHSFPPHTVPAETCDTQCRMLLQILSGANASLVIGYSLTSLTIKVNRELQTKPETKPYGESHIQDALVFHDEFVQDEWVHPEAGSQVFWRIRGDS